MCIISVDPASDLGDNLDVNPYFIGEKPNGLKDLS
jgi:hypothetical protein